MIDEKIKYLIAVELENELKQAVTTHDGELKRSIKIIPTKKGLRISMLRYGEFVEFGSPPHAIPTSLNNPDSEPIRKWVRDKWGDENLIYALANHIKKYGTEPHPFVRTVFKQKLPRIIEKYAKESQ